MKEYDGFPPLVEIDDQSSYVPLRAIRRQSKKAVRRRKRHEQKESKTCQ